MQQQLCQFWTWNVPWIQMRCNDPTIKTQVLSFHLHNPLKDEKYRYIEIMHGDNRQKRLEESEEAKTSRKDACYDRIDEA